MFRHHAHGAASCCIRADTHACNAAVRIANDQHPNTAKRCNVRIAQRIRIAGIDTYGVGIIVRLGITVGIGITGALAARLYRRSACARHRLVHIHQQHHRRVLC
jgi:hypothetical protein